MQRSRRSNGTALRRELAGSLTAESRIPLGRRRGMPKNGMPALIEAAATSGPFADRRLLPDEPRTGGEAARHSSIRQWYASPEGEYLSAPDSRSASMDHD